MFKKSFLKQVKFLLFFFCSFFCINIVQAEEIKIEIKSQAELVRENTFQGQLPMKFRSSRMMYVTSRADGKGAGLNFLRISGSDQFSENELKWLMDHLGTPLAVVDLRDDAHVFVNGTSVSWKDAPKLTITEEVFLWNADIKTKQAFLKEKDRELLKQFSLGEEVKLPLMKIAKLSKAKTGNEKTVIYKLMTEENLLKEYGISYLRIPFKEEDLLNNEAVDTFLGFYQSLPKGTWVHFHCQNGERKTAFYLVLCDILKNAGAVSLEDIIKRNAQVPPFYDLAKLPIWETKPVTFSNPIDVSDYLPIATKTFDYTRRGNLDAWRPSGVYVSLLKQKEQKPKERFSLKVNIDFNNWTPTVIKERRSWLENFYKFAEVLKKGYGGTWSEWQKMN